MHRLHVTARGWQNQSRSPPVQISEVVVAGAKNSRIRQDSPSSHSLPCIPCMPCRFCPILPGLSRSPRLAFRPGQVDGHNKVLRSHRFLIAYLNLYSQQQCLQTDQSRTARAARMRGRTLLSWAVVPPEWSVLLPPSKMELLRLLRRSSRVPILWLSIRTNSESQSSSACPSSAGKLPPYPLMRRNTGLPG